MLFANILFLGGVSGGHFNPAVTLGVLVREGPTKMVQNLPMAALYWVAQILGCILGVFCVFMTTRTEYDINDANHLLDNRTVYPAIAALCPGISTGTWT